MAPGIASWQELLKRALTGSSPAAHYFQLATADEDGIPDSRTVVFRGFLPTDDDIAFVSDSRSAKVRQANANPHGAICWYIGEKRQQFRLQGRLIVVGAETENTELAQARQSAWKRLTRRTRMQFFWPEPGAVRTPDPRFEPAEPEDAHIPENFVFCFLSAERVFHLDLNHRPPDRFLFERQADNAWQLQAVNP